MIQEVQQPQKPQEQSTTQKPLDQLKTKKPSDQLSLDLFKIPQCIICFDFLDKNITALLCGHLYHTKCLRQNQRHREQCPQCKIPYDPEQCTEIYFEAQKRKRFLIASEDQLNNQPIKFAIKEQDAIMQDENLHENFIQMQAEYQQLKDSHTKLHQENQQAMEQIEDLQIELQQKRQRHQHALNFIRTHSNQRHRLEKSIQFKDQQILDMKQFLANQQTRYKDMEKICREKIHQQKQCHDKYLILSSKCQKEMEIMKLKMETLQMEKNNTHKQNIDLSIQLLKLQKYSKKTSSQTQDTLKPTTLLSNPVQTLLHQAGSSFKRQLKQKQLAQNDSEQSENLQHLINTFTNPAQKNNKNNQQNCLPLKSSKHCPEQKQEKSQEFTNDLKNMKKKISKDFKDIIEKKKQSHSKITTTTPNSIRNFWKTNLRKQNHILNLMQQ